MKNQRVVALSMFWTLCIVMYHCGGRVVTPWYRELMSDFRVGGVSFFFIVSGYFLIKHYKKESVWMWWRKEVVKRVRTLLVPYFIWCVLGLTSFDLIHQFGFVGIVPQANPPLWYVKFLFLFCLASPLLIVAIGSLGERAGWFIGTLALIVLPWLHFPLKFSLVHSLLMFAVGLWLGLNRVNWSLSHPVRWGLSVFVLWIALFFTRIICLESGFPSWPLRVYSAVLLVLGIWLLGTRIEFHRELPQFFRCSFWIYCSHGLALRWSTLPDATTISVACANGLIVFVLVVFLVCLCSRCFSRLYNILTGNRS